MSRRISAYYRKCDIRDLLFDYRENISNEEMNRILVWQPIHGTRKNQTVFYNFDFARREIIRIHACRDRENILDSKIR